MTRAEIEAELQRLEQQQQQARQMIEQGMAILHQSIGAATVLRRILSGMPEAAPEEKKT